MSTSEATAPEDPAELEAGRLLFERECGFVAGAATEDMLPDLALPEIAFAGRSNVGKSSLINALTRQTRLARTSRTPGRTQQINFFELGGALMLVDLPGYGYARASKTRVGEWNELIHFYLRGRPNLHRVCLLIDSRHGLKPNDLSLMAELDEAAVVYQFILTKTDKISQAKLDGLIKSLTAIFPDHPAAHPVIHGTSAREDQGIAGLRAELAMLAAQDQFG